MPISQNVEEKIFVKAGSVGFPEPEILEEFLIHNGQKIRKTAQLTVVHHNNQGVRYKLSVLEYEMSVGLPVREKSRISLGEDATEALFKYLLAKDNFSKLAQTTSYMMAENVAPLDKSSIENLAKILCDLLSVKEINEDVPKEIITNIAAALYQHKYKNAIAELEQMLQQTHSEKDFERWFVENHWVFGTEYLQVEEAKIAWQSDGDIVLTSLDGYQDIIELKLPTEVVLVFDASHDNYYPSAPLTKAVSQAAKYIHESEDARTMIQSKEKLPFLKPRAKIVIGRNTDWKEEMSDSLRIYNSSLSNIQVMTYDHLIAIGKRMLQYYE